MPKPRTKRKDVREERKRKHEDDVAEAPADEQEQSLKRQRVEGDADADADNYAENEGGNGKEDEGYYFDTERQQGIAGEPQFFGMLTDEEQEYFRGAAEVLEMNDFAAPEDRAIFVENVFKEAEGKEMKLACSQGCSRLMEKLILLSSMKQKKQLFEALAGNFLALVQHRFASHCCEMLFLQAAPFVGEDTAAEEEAGEEEEGDGEKKPEMTMEDLFLLTLDELEADLSFLLTQTYASHTLRALLLILSGKPLEGATSSSLLKSKRKERVSVPGVTGQEDPSQQERTVPESFTMAVQKIISDTIMGLDNSGLRILVTHPTGNPILQLLLELDITYNAKAKKTKGEDAPETLLSRLLPGAPDSLKDETSKASEFVTAMVYDQIGSRLLETLIVHAPGKTFKAMHQTIFAKRIQSYVRNEIASYPAIKVLVRLSKDDLVACAEEIIPVIPTLVEKSRLNVIKTLLNRCAVREAEYEVEKVAQALVQACGGRFEDIVPKLCLLREDEGGKGKVDPQRFLRNKQALVSHGAQLVSTMLSIPAAAEPAQVSLLALSPEERLKLATDSMPTMAILKTALAKPSDNPFFHKVLVASLLPHIADLATSQAGHNVVNEILTVPSKGRGHSVPFHIKEGIMTKLAENEALLRDSWMGRSVWRTWKGDVWKRGRVDWGTWAKGAESAGGDVFAAAPTKRLRPGERSDRGENKPANPHIARRFARQAERKAEREKKRAWEARQQWGGDVEMGEAPVEGGVEKSEAAPNGEPKQDEEMKAENSKRGKDEKVEVDDEERKQQKREKKEKKKAEREGESAADKEARRARKREKKERKAAAAAGEA